MLPRSWDHVPEHIIAQMEKGTFDWAVFDPLDVAMPSLRVDTTNGYVPGLEVVIAFCRDTPTAG